MLHQISSEQRFDYPIDTMGTLLAAVPVLGKKM